MATVTIQLPDDVKSLVELRAASKGIADVGEFMGSLIVDALHQMEEDEINEKLRVGLEQLERGEGREMTPADWQRLRQEHLERMQKRKGQ